MNASNSPSPDFEPLGPSAHGLSPLSARSKTINTDCFGRGIRWFLVRVGTIHWSVALSVPIGLLAVVLLILLPSITGDNTVESLQWGFGLLIGWVAGLSAQCVTIQLLLEFLKRRWPNTDAAQCPATVVTLTVAGVWSSIPLRGETGHSPAPAARVLLLWASLLIVMPVLAVLLIWVAASRDPGISHVWIAALDQPVVAIAWLCILQGIWQLLPLPQSMGRVGWSVVIGLMTRCFDEIADDELSAATVDESDWDGAAVRSVRRVRLWIVAFSFLVLIGGTILLHVSGVSTQSGGNAISSFAGITLLALWLFASARGADLYALQSVMQQNRDIGRLHGTLNPSVVVRRWRDRVRARQQLDGLRAIRQREHSEAHEAKRADEILSRLHEDGPDSLSEDDRALLARVSEALRRERSAGNETDGTIDGEADVQSGEP